MQLPSDPMSALAAARWQDLDCVSIAGVPLHNVTLLRLEGCGGKASGNKWFKLQGYLEQAKAGDTLVSFGGAWSNHLHALAATGHALGVATVGLVRGELPQPLTPMLRDAQGWGMQLQPLTRSQYRLRHDRDFQIQIRERYAPCVLIPEGGDGCSGAAGCVAIGEYIASQLACPARVVLPVGTGTTLAGVAAGLPEHFKVIGVSALKGAHDLEQRVENALAGLGREAAPWQIWHDEHCGGFARSSDELREFVLDFEATTGVELDPVYTAKALFAVYRRLRAGEAAPPTVVVHTGGLQGRRGFSWLHST